MLRAQALCAGLAMTQTELRGRVALVGKRPELCCRPATIARLGRAVPKRPNFAEGGSLRIGAPHGFILSWLAWLLIHDSLPV